MTDNAPVKALPFVRDMLVANIPSAGFDFRASATPEECAALAKVARIPAIERVDVKARIVPRGERFEVSGEVTADIVQTCVVSLEDFATRVVEPIDVGYATPARIAADAARRAEEPDEDDPDSIEVDPDEPILSEGAANERLDIGRLAAELLMLGIDPHPRKPGAVFHAAVAEEPRNSPFAQLAALKDSDKNGNK